MEFVYYHVKEDKIIVLSFLKHVSLFFLMLDVGSRYTDEDLGFVYLGVL